MPPLNARNRQIAADAPTAIDASTMTQGGSSFGSIMITPWLWGPRPPVGLQVCDAFFSGLVRPRSSFLLACKSFAALGNAEVFEVTTDHATVLDPGRKLSSVVIETNDVANLALLGVKLA